MKPIKNINFILATLTLMIVGAFSFSANACTGASDEVTTVVLKDKSGAAVATIVRKAAGYDTKTSLVTSPFVVVTLEQPADGLHMHITPITAAAGQGMTTIESQQLTPKLFLVGGYLPANSHIMIHIEQKGSHGQLFSVDSGQQYRGCDPTLTQVIKP